MADKVSGLYPTKFSYLCRTCSTLVPYLFHTCSAPVPYL